MYMWYHSYGVRNHIGEGGKMPQYGMMSDVDIRKAINDKEMCITPFDANDYLDKRLTPVGFNFSFSRFVVSLNQRTFFKIHEKNDEMYFYLEQGDTAIALTTESIWVSKYFGGTFHSKVGYVSLGLGHISTTLDPYWQGQLLISLNNPSKRKIKVVIARFVNGVWRYSTFITLCLYRMGTAASKPSDNNAARLDTLYDIIKNDVKTKGQKKVVDAVREMLTFMSGFKDGNLSNKDAVSEDDINKYVSDHQAVLSEWDDKFPIIQTLSNRVLLIKKIIRLLPKLSLVLFVVLLGIVAYLHLDQQDFLISIISLCAAIVGAFIALLWGKRENG